VASATELAAQAALYGIVSAVVVETLIRRLPVPAPGDRFRYRLCTLILPVALPPLFGALAPLRATEAFADLALFSTSRWQRLAVAGVGLRDLGLAVLGVLGAALVLRDIWRDALHWWRDRRALRPRGTHRGAADPDPVLQAEVEGLARRMGIATPRLLLLDTDAAILHCRGVRRPTVMVARGVVDRLAPDQLRGALAHELAHVRHRDVERGWLLALLRAVQWFNPVAQLVARRAALEVEWRADAEAAAVTAQPLALARALLTCVRGRDTEFLGLLGRGRVAALEQRCRRLLDGVPARQGRADAWSLTMVGAGLSVLLFFVV